MYHFDCLAPWTLYGQIINTGRKTMSDQLKLFGSQPVLFYRGYKVFPSHIYHENQTAGISCCASKPWLLIFFTYAENCLVILLFI